MIELPGVIDETGHPKGGPFYFFDGGRAPNWSLPDLTVRRRRRFYNEVMTFDTVDVLLGVFGWAKAMLQAEPAYIALGLGTAGLWLLWQVVALALPQRSA